MEHKKKITHPSLKFVIETVEKDLSKNYTLGELAESIKYSERHMARIFKEELGVTYSSYCAEKKLTHAKKLLEQTELTIGHISKAIGIHSQSYFCRLFKKHYGITPSQHRELSTDN